MRNTTQRKAPKLILIVKNFLLQDKETKYFGPCTSLASVMNNLGIYMDPSKMNATPRK